jgi:hypothetical protein
MEVKMTQFKCLAPDGAYSHGASGISGYTPESASLKEQFLRDARALLKQTQQFLAKSGWSEYLICVNPAGMAVSGDVFADFWAPADPLNIVYCTIGASAVHFGGRQDGLIIMARQEKRQLYEEGRRPSRKSLYRRTWMGINQWIDPGMNSRQLASQILKIAGAPEGEEQSLLPGCVYHSSSAGSIPVPSGMLRNRTDALAWRAAIGNVIEAGRADALAHGEKETGPTAKSALRQTNMFEALENPGGQGGDHV